MRIFLLLLLTLPSLLACSPTRNSEPTSPMASADTSFATRLEQTGYAKLFFYGDRGADKEFWANGANKGRLEALAQDPNARPFAQFLAWELLKENGHPDIPAAALPLAAKAYAEALRLTGADIVASGLNGNVWGFLYPENDPGDLGKRFIEMGKAAIPALKPLLDDDHLVYYEGSEEATVGNALHYRVKDFAAFYLSKITGIPIVYHKDNAARDQAISQFKKQLSSQ